MHPSNRRIAPPQLPRDAVSGATGSSAETEESRPISRFGNGRFVRNLVPILRGVVGAVLVAGVALGVAWATLVASELIAAQQGLGALIQNASSFFQLDIIYVGIVCIGFIALAMDLALRAATRRLVAWQDRLA